MNRNAPIYPEVEIYAEKNYIIAKTTLRIKHRGKWYLWFHEHKWIIDGDESYTPSKDAILYSKIDVLRRLIDNVRMTELFGKVNPKLVDGYGELIFKLDPDQRSEQERILADRPYLKL